MRIDHWLVKAVFFAALLTVMPLGVAQAEVTVTSATPSSTLQGTVSLDVEIAGSGFDSSAQVDFLVTGTTNPGGITVKKVVARGSKKLIATIDVAEDATATDFDVQVTLSGGRKGKGITLFKVQAKVTNANDPCADPSLDFPAFIYRQVTAVELEWFVADADGKCSRSVAVFQNGAGVVASFSYPIAGTTNVGRVAWPNAANDSIDWLDFTVNESDHSIVISSVQSKGLGFDVGGDGFELSSDGRTVYFSFWPLEFDQSGSVFKISIEDPAASPVHLYTGPVGYIHNALSVSADQSILVIEESNIVAPELHRVIRLCLTGDSCELTLAEDPHGMYPAVGSDGSMVAHQDYQEGSNNCWLLRYLDAQGQRLYEGTQPRYGRYVSWLDGKILANGVSAPSRRNKCAYTDSIVKIDPTTGSEVTLVRGYDPDAR
jgi:hypothetical protein